MPSTPATVGLVKNPKKKGLSIEEKIVLVEQWISAHPQPYTMKELMQRIPKQTPVIYQSVEECVRLLVAEGRIDEDRVGVSTLYWKFMPTATQQANKSRRPPGKIDGLGSRSGSSAGAGRGLVTFADLLGRLTATGAAAPRQPQTLSTETVKNWCALTPDAELRKWCDLLHAENDKTMAALTKERKRLGFEEDSGSGEHVSEDAPSDEEALLAELAHLQQLTHQRAQLLAEQRALTSRQALPELLDQLTRSSSIALDAANRWTDNYYIAEEEIVGKSRFGGSRRDVRAALQLPLDLDYLSDESEAEQNSSSGHEQRKVDDRKGSPVPHTVAPDAAPRPRSPPQQESRPCNSSGSPSTQGRQPATTASPLVDPPLAAYRAHSSPKTNVSQPPPKPKKAGKTKAARPPPAQRAIGKRSRS